MRVIITACTERNFSKELVPLAHLMFGEVCAVNDNELRFPVVELSALTTSRQKSRRGLKAPPFRRIQDHSAPSTAVAAAIVTTVGTPIAW